MPRIQALDSSPVPEIKGEVLTSLTKDMPKFLDMADALDSNGAGIEDIARTVGNIMQYGGSESSKLAAARLASELRGVAKGKDASTINFIISDTNGLNLMNIFNPAR